ncbi:alpha/beta hydrolase [Mycolicibacterium farcinogenes]|nr:alpha/beta hydrolase [Mycolicibacterium farcinogenes]
MVLTVRGAGDATPRPYRATPTRPLRYRRYPAVAERVEVRRTATRPDRPLRGVRPDHGRPPRRRACARPARRRDLADDVERRLDEIGWCTAHIVGNSLGGWVAFELERRGRARTLTGIAPAGGWSRFTPAKYEIIAKFLAALPLVLATAAFRQQLLKLPLTKQISYLAVSATPEVLNDSDRHDLIEDLAHCPAYFKLMVKALTTAGLMEIKNSRTPTQLVICEKDRVLPAPRFTRHFTASLAPDAVVKTLKGVGHVPMFEAPDTITQVITEFVDRHIDPARATG